MMGGGDVVNNTTAACTMKIHGERWVLFGHIYHDVKIAYDSLRGMRAKAAQRRRRWGRRSVVSPMQSPSFRNTHSVHSDPQDAHTSKFVLLQPPSLFSLPLSLRWRSSVYPLLPLSPSLSLFSLSPSPPLFAAIGGLVFFFFTGQLNFRRQTHTLRQHHIFAFYFWRIHIYSATSALII